MADTVMSPLVLAIRQRATDGDLWTKGDLTFVRKAFAPPPELIETLDAQFQGPGRNYFFTQGDREDLKGFMNSEDVVALAGSDGRELIRRLIDWRVRRLSGAVHSRPMRYRERSRYIDEIFTYGNLAEKTEAMRRVMAGGDRDSKIAAAKAYAKLAVMTERKEANDEALALRTLMAEGDETTKGAAATAYGALWYVLERGELEKGAAMLRELMVSGKAETKIAALAAYRNLAPNLERGEVAKGVAVLRNLVTDNAPAFLVGEVAETYRALVPKIEDETEAVQALTIFGKWRRSFRRTFSFDEISYKDVSSLFSALVPRIKAEDALRLAMDLRQHRWMKSYESEDYADYVLLMKRAGGETESDRELSELRHALTSPRSTPAAVRWACHAYTAFVPQMSEAEVREGLIALRHLMASPRPLPDPEEHAAPMYVALVPKIAQEDVPREAAALRTLIEKGRDDTKRAALQAYASLAPRIEGEEVNRGARALRTLIATADDRPHAEYCVFSEGHEYHYERHCHIGPAAAAAYAALAPRITGDEVDKGTATLRKAIAGSNDFTRQFAVIAYGALAKKVGSEEASRGIVALWRSVSQGSPDRHLHTKLGDALAAAYIALAPRLSEDAVSREWALLKKMPRYSFGGNFKHLAQGVHALLLPRMEGEDIRRRAAALRWMMVEGACSDEEGLGLYGKLVARMAEGDVREELREVRKMMVAVTGREGISMSWYEGIQHKVYDVGNRHIHGGQEDVLAMKTDRARNLAVLFYKAIAQKISTEEILGAEAAELRQLIVEGDEATRAAAAEAQHALKLKINKESIRAKAATFREEIMKEDSWAQCRAAERYRGVASLIEGDDILTEVQGLMALLPSFDCHLDDGIVGAHLLLTPEVSGGVVGPWAAHLRTLMKRYNGSNAAPTAYKTLSRQFDSDMAGKEAPKLRAMMASNDHSFADKVAGLAYLALVDKFSPDVAAREAAALRTLMAGGGHPAEYSVEPYLALIPRLGKTAVRNELRGLEPLLAQAATVNIAFYPYLQLLDRLEGEELERGSAVIRMAASRFDIDIPPPPRGSSLYFKMDPHAQKRDEEAWERLIAKTEEKRKDIVKKVRTFLR